MVDFVGQHAINRLRAGVVLMGAAFAPGGRCSIMLDSVDDTINLTGGLWPQWPFKQFWFVIQAGCDDFGDLAANVLVDFGLPSDRMMHCLGCPSSLRKDSTN
jgi:hypothetical protein